MPRKKVEDNIVENETENNGVIEEQPPLEGGEAESTGEAGNPVLHDDTAMDSATAESPPEDHQEPILPIPSRQRSQQSQDLRDILNAQGDGERESGRPQTMRILGEDGRWIEDEESPIGDDLYQLSAARNTKKILTATLTGYDKPNGLKPLAICYYGDVKVMIPVSEMKIHLDRPSESEYENNERYAQIINSMIGARIDFIVKGVDVKNSIAVASRVEAMDRKRRTVLNAMERDGTYRIYDGMVVEGRVTNVTENGARVEIFGFETMLHATRIQQKFIANVRTVFSPGDVIRVKLVKVSRNRNGEVVRLDISMRDLTREREEKAIEKVNVGSRYMGQVTRRRGNLIFVRLNDANVDIACHLDGNYTIDIPYIGTTVMVRVKYIGEGDGLLYGSITRVYSRFRPDVAR